MSRHRQEPTLVLGGTGKIGRRVVERRPSAPLGREPRDFSDYARRAAATGSWNPMATRAA